MDKSPFAPLSRAYSLTTPLFHKAKPSESSSPAMAPASYSVTNIPLPPAPQAPQQLNLPVQKSSFFFLALGLMILGICFFLAGFLFSLWVSKNSSNISSVAGPHRARVSSKNPSAALSSQISNVPQELKKATEALPALSKVLHGNRSQTHTKKEALSTPSGRRYGIQLGAFVTQENAIDLVNRLKSRKISALIKTEKDDAGAKLFCVRTTDEFSNYQSAESAASSLFRQETLSAFVVPLVNLKQKT